MRRYSLSLLATAAAISFSASVASAADLPRKAPAYVPPAPPPFSWTGFYIGGHGGAGWGTVETSLGNVCDPFGFCVNTGGNAFSQTQLNGWLGGGTVGYNWQVNPWLVLGLEGDFTWTDIKGTSPCSFEGFFGPFTTGGSCGTKVKWTADVTGRIGFAVDRALLYVKGGAVWAKSDHTFSANIPAGPPGFFNTITASESDTRLGGLLGAGIEYAFLPNWSAKIEYNYMDFGHSDRVFPGSVCSPFGGCNAFTADINLREVLHTVKVGVNYRFDWGRY